MSNLRKLKPRRMPLNAVDAGQNSALLLIRAALRNDEVSKELGNAVKLMKMKLKSPDIADLTGLTREMVTRLGKKEARALAPTGRKIQSVGTVVQDANTHVKASGFLVMLEQVLASDSHYTLTADVFIAAIDALEVFTHQDVESTPYNLYVVLARRFMSREIYLTDCPRCKNRFLQLSFDQRDLREPLEGECPHCRLVSSVMGCRPNATRGEPTLRRVSRIKRKISDQETTTKAFRMIVGDGWG
ncbi:hypothetical protein IPT12_15200 [Xanthomonas perforans]|uniref:Transcriptional regulator n=10 Tax=Xanthomonas TaxID=338 RepID=A0ABS8L3T9_9XANT|nr:MULTISPECIES: hypothetical protein [Xanthomonas]MEB1846159.1 hypothetical protein [Xanthomonas campestris pv. campestris]EGD10754.1 hypothetical protein XVE_0809 [Xanthomonas vesicatoria ATCC 35937]KLC50908.1 hypothetical protein XP1511_00080 [Xanthomonas perforans]MBD1532353.1 hypothetical protein [Xanthomonas citri pv. citri]MBD4081540.1 hypothetical protein [Xanthomonas citri pv. citri]